MVYKYNNKLTTCFNEVLIKINTKAGNLFQKWEESAMAPFCIKQLNLRRQITILYFSPSIQLL